MPGALKKNTAQEEQRELGVIVILGMYKFSTDALTNCHKFSGLK